jgi:hypothetical protein
VENSVTHADVETDKQQQAHMAEAHVVSVSASISLLRNEISQLAQQVTELKSGLQAITVPPSELSIVPDDKNLGALSAIAANIVKKPLYSNVAVAGLDSVVKQAVESVLTKQKRDDCSRVSVVLYGLQESGHDHQDVRNIAHMGFFDVTIASIARLGRPAVRVGGDAVPKARPLKVELSSLSDKDYLLSLSKDLKWHKKYKLVRISPYLTQDEMKKVNILREEQYKLNLALPVADGIKPKYVVISGRLMRRCDSGKLIPVRDALQAVINMTADGVQPKDMHPCDAVLSDLKNGRGGGYSTPLHRSKGRCGNLNS